MSNALPFAVTLAFTASLSACSVKLSPTLGTTDIFAAPSFTAKVKSSALPDKAKRACFSVSSALSTSVCVASCLSYTFWAFTKASS